MLRVGAGAAKKRLQRGSQAVAKRLRAMGKRIDSEQNRAVTNRRFESVGRGTGPQSRGGGRKGAWRLGAPGPHAHGNVGRRVVDDRRAEVSGQRTPSNDRRSNQHSPGTPTTALRERGNDTSRSTGRSGRQTAATRRNMRRGERVTVQGPVKKQHPDGMSHGGGGLQMQDGQQRNQGEQGCDAMCPPPERHGGVPRDTQRGT